MIKIYNKTSYIVVIINITASIYKLCLCTSVIWTNTVQAAREKLMLTSQGSASQLTQTLIYGILNGNFKPNIFN